METISKTKKEVSKIHPLEIEPQTKLVEEEVKTTEPKVGIEPLIATQVETT